MNINKYPIYIISKGRWNRRSTVKTLESMNVSYKIVVEPKEYENYANVINNENIITTPQNFSELGCGSIPVRNFVFKMSLNNGDTRHWILDDNIESIERYNHNLKIPCRCPQPFRICEDFVDRYKNIALAGMNYVSFCPASDGRPPFQMNTRIYSCILINNIIPYRWRGRYNEDTDLSLRCLKDGWNTILFNAFLIGKRATMTQNGGNTNTIYNKGDERLEFAKSLAELHPDCVKVVRRFNRWHHQVDYKRFKDRELEYRDDFVFNGDNINNYGMILRKKETLDKIKNL